MRCNNLRRFFDTFDLEKRGFATVSTLYIRRYFDGISEIQAAAAAAAPKNGQKRRKSSRFREKKSDFFRKVREILAENEVSFDFRFLDTFDLEKRVFATVLTLF